ncbi:MAG: hypothetical protein VCD00_04885 [Candidatus Hydrogenedentota bacterium]
MTNVTDAVKSESTRHISVHRCAIVFALTAYVGLDYAVPTFAEDLIYFEPHTGYTEIVDSENPGRFAQSSGLPHSVVSNGTRAGNLTFIVTYADVTASNGIGFDDATFGATRRATVVSVLTYVNNVLNETTGATIDISIAVSQMDGTGSLASAGTIWFTSPNRFDNGFAFEHITTGSDPLGGTHDLNVTVDFGYTWNSDTGTPTGSEYDLFTVMLHEITHGLGFIGLSDASGNSALSGGSPGVFTVLTDGLTRITGAVDLWNSSFAFVGNAFDLVSNDVGFSGTNSIAENGNAIPKIYSPISFSGGSSLSHWDTPTFPDEIMKHAIASGVQSLTYGALGIAALKDIGYSDAAPVKISTVNTDFDWTGSERGTSSFPVNSFAQAVEMVASSGTIRLDGTAADRQSNWTGTINSATTIQLNPAGSSVKIGVPGTGSDSAQENSEQSGFVSRSKN